MTYVLAYTFLPQIRPYTKQDAATVGYTPKPRTGGRLRTRPTTTLSPPTTTRDPEVQTYVDESYQQISRFNKDFYQDAPIRTKNTPQRNHPKGVRVSAVNDQVIKYTIIIFCLKHPDSILFLAETIQVRSIRIGRPRKPVVNQVESELFHPC